MNTDVIAAPRYRDSSVFVLEPSPAPFHPIPLETLLKPAEFEQVQWVELSRNATIAGVTIIAFVPVDILTHRPHLAWLFTCRVALMLCAFVVASTVKNHAKWRKLILSASGVWCSVVAGALCFFAGPSDLVALIVLATLPLTYALATCASPSSTLFTSVASFATLFIVLRVGDTTAENLTIWLTTELAFGILASGSALLRHRAYRESMAAHRALYESTVRLQTSEERRTHAERLAMVGQLAAGVAHEINNPLAFVRANLNFLKTEVDLWPLPLATKEEALAVFAETETGVDRITSIVRDLKLLASADGEDNKLPPQRTELLPLVNEALRMAEVRMKSAVTVHVEVAAGTSAVVQPRKMVQVLLNLLINAADALEGRVNPAPTVWVKLGLTPTNALRMSVEDNGPGIPASVRPHLFQPFFTTKPVGKGTGLGLALCREQVRSFGGEFTHAERLDGGAIFHISFAATPEVFP